MLIIFSHNFFLGISFSLSMAMSLLPPNMSLNNSFQLPNFVNMLIKGPYPPSAPIYLSASFLKKSAPENQITRKRVLFLSSDRENLSKALQDYNDVWLTENSMKGDYASIFKCINIL